MALNAENLRRPAGRNGRSLRSVVKDRTLKNWICRVNGLLCPKNDKYLLFLRRYAENELEKICHQKNEKY